MCVCVCERERDRVTSILISACMCVYVWERERRSHLSTSAIIWRFSTAWYGTVRYGTVHFWGVFHWVLYLVPDTFLVPLRSRFHASRYRYQNVTCKLCWSLNGRRKSSLLRHWTCDTRPSSTALPARFKSAQPAKDRTQLLFKQTHIFASTTK